MAKKRGLSNERLKLTDTGAKPCLLSLCCKIVKAMAYLNIKLPEEKDKCCEFTFSNDIADDMMAMIKRDLEIPYLQREENMVGDRTTLKLPNVPESMRKLYRQCAVRLFLKQGCEISEN